MATSSWELSSVHCSFYCPVKVGFLSGGQIRPFPDQTLWSVYHIVLLWTYKILRSTMAKQNKKIVPKQFLPCLELSSYIKINIYDKALTLNL